MLPIFTIECEEHKGTRIIPHANKYLLASTLSEAMMKYVDLFLWGNMQNATFEPDCLMIYGYKSKSDIKITGKRFDMNSDFAKYVVSQKRKQNLTSSDEELIDLYSRELP